MSFRLVPHPNTKTSWPLMLATIFVSLCLVVILVLEADERQTRGRVYPGVTVGGMAIGGMTPDAAARALEERAAQILDRGFTFTIDGTSIALPASLSALQDPDLTVDIIRYNIEATVTRAYRIGRAPHPIDSMFQKISARIHGISIDPVIDVDEARLIEALRINTAHLVTPSTNATLTFTPPASFNIEPEIGGTTLTYADGAKTLLAHLRSFTAPSVTLLRIPDVPVIRVRDVERLIEEARAIIARPPLTMNAVVGTIPYGYTVTPERTGSWLTVVPGEKGPMLDLRAARVDDYLTAIASTIEVEPRDAKFSVSNGRVTEFQSSQRGVLIDRSGTLANLRRAIILEPASTETTLALTIIPATTDMQTANDFGIRELLGVGHSNFKGSPANRRHNIRTGAKALHGIMIAPKEEFSLLQALGEINAASGYLPELVIKGNKTIPEFGGGLCQIGTTLFRAVMASALPIIERQNHSYSVTYYLEDGKPGKDATIYSPKPDFRFVNDTQFSILIQTRIEGDDIYFEFWGTKDGRAQIQSEVKTWGLRRPPPTKIVETEDLPEGKKKCTERPHNGINAEFTYTIIMPDETKKEQVFRSSYRPWQEVCLVGVPKGSLTRDDATAPTTTETQP